MVDCIHMYQVVWVLCPIKLDIEASGVNLLGHTSFSIELELMKLPLKLSVDDSMLM